MAVVNNNLVTIDLNEWSTPSELAKQWNVTRQVVNNWYARGKLERVFIEELGLTLVKIIPDKFTKKLDSA
jgi:hypothetical protein